MLPILVQITGTTVIQQEVREACAETIGKLGETRAVAEQMYNLLYFYKHHSTFSYHREPPVDALFHALWRISRRAGLLVLPSLNPDADSYAYRLIERGATFP